MFVVNVVGPWDLINMVVRQEYVDELIRRIEREREKK